MDRGILEFKGSGCEGAISETDTEGMAEIGKVETMGFGKGSTDKIPTSTRIYQEGALDTVNGGEYGK